MPAKDNYRAEMDLVNAHGVFAVDPNHLTTPIRMAAIGHCANPREAMAIAAEVDDPLQVSGHTFCTVGEFMEAARRRQKRTKPR